MLPPAWPIGGGDEAEGAGHVGDLDVQAGEPPGAHQAAHDHRRQQARVDVAAAEHHADLPAGEAVGVLEQRGDARGARALDHHLLDLEQEVHRLLHRRVLAR